MTHPVSIHFADDQGVVGGVAGDAASDEDDSVAGMGALTIVQPPDQTGGVTPDPGTPVVVDSWSSSDGDPSNPDGGPTPGTSIASTSTSPPAATPAALAEPGGGVVGPSAVTPAATSGASLHPADVGPPGVGESLIPVWGSGRQAIHDFQNGSYGWGVVNTALALNQA